MLALVCALAAASPIEDDELSDLRLEQVAPAPSPEAAAAIERLAVIERFRDEALYVMDAWVVKRTRTNALVTFGGGAPPAGAKQRWFTVAYGARPVWDRKIDPGSFRSTRVVSEEWVVCDGRGRLLDEVEFARQVGEEGQDPRRRGVVLDGVQVAWDRATAESLASRVTAEAAAATGVDATEQDNARSLARSSLPEPEWSTSRPKPIRAPD